MLKMSERYLDRIIDNQIKTKWTNDSGVRIRKAHETHIRLPRHAILVFIDKKRLIYWLIEFTLNDDLIRRGTQLNKSV